VVEAVFALVGVVAFVLLAAAYVRGGLVVSFDDDVSRWVVDSISDPVATAARVITSFGGPFVGAIVTLGAVVVLVRGARRADAVFVAAAAIGVTVIVAILKAIYERARPELGTLIPLPHSYSFPSGHSATAVVLYGSLGILLAERAHTRARAVAWLVAAAAFAVAIGASRVALNVHFVSDVAAGLAVGLAWLCCCAIVRDVIAAR
jgi:undecaprenyl-diphosphatase